MASNNPHRQNQHDLLVIDKHETDVPKQYAVVILNDDYTPMDFVIDVLQRFFQLNIDRATEVMLAIHYKGKGIAGTYTKDIAQTKSTQVNEYARANRHPLLSEIQQI